MEGKKVAQVIMWFRRDLRVTDNAALFFALRENKDVLPIFIFDKNILTELEEHDARVTFVFDAVMQLRDMLRDAGGDLRIYYDSPDCVFENLVKKHGSIMVYINEDYEPYARERDHKVADIVRKGGGTCRFYKDHVVFAPHEIVKENGSPYEIFTPYKKRWMESVMQINIEDYASEHYTHHLKRFLANDHIRSLEDIGFHRSSIVARQPIVGREFFEQYAQTRDYPALENGTSHLGPHVRFGLVSIRKIVQEALQCRERTFLSELIWREFFQMILWHHPHTINRSYKSQYDKILWHNDHEKFARWCDGKTGYPFVDAGMRELRETGYMHNRVRMVTASFLCKHLLIDWRWGERYFAKHLLDYELASNVGNWQWVAGSGCDAAPYFRVFNPTIQAKKYDPQEVYVKRWVPEKDTGQYVCPIIDHAYARIRAIDVYRKSLGK